MEKVSLEKYQELIANSQILEKDVFGLKVLETPNNKIIKLFRLKRKLSSAILWPYAERFAHNAKKLAAMNIPALHIERVLHCPSIERHLVVYSKIPGDSLREKLSQKPDRLLIQKLADFVAELHQKGIYFRSLHLGNILLQPDGKLALIDFADMRFSCTNLSPKQRARNFHHLLRYPSDAKILRQYGLNDFFDYYAKKAGLTGRRLAAFDKQQSKLNGISHSS